jgi:hypothetical protein
MRSRYGDVFNHDDEADGYDSEVRNEKDPCGLMTFFDG